MHRTTFLSFGSSLCFIGSIELLYGSVADYAMKILINDVLNASDLNYLSFGSSLCFITISSIDLFYGSLADFDDFNTYNE